MNNKCLELNGAKNLEFNSMALPRRHYLLRVQWSEKSLSWNLNLERYKKKWSFRYGNSAVFGEYFGPRTTRASAHVWNVGLYPIHKTTISAHSAYFLFYFFIKKIIINNFIFQLLKIQRKIYLTKLKTIHACVFVFKIDFFRKTR